MNQSIFHYFNLIDDFSLLNINIKYFFLFFFICFAYRSSGPAISVTKTVPPKAVHSKVSEDKPKTPETIASGQPFLALPTNPIIIIPYSLVRAANVLPGPL